MTTQSPYGWAIAHYNRGVHLGEEVYALTTPKEGGAWVVRAERWYNEARDGVAARSPEDVGWFDTISPFRLLPLSSNNPFYEPYEPISMVMSSTGFGQPGNNPANWHAARVVRMKEIADRWAAKPLPRKTGPEDLRVLKQIGIAQDLRDASVITKRAAATEAVKQRGRGLCKSKNAAIDMIRRRLR